MGTSLTGLTPATTYDALIKVGDNAPLDGTLKTLSDGLGNDSALALSTGAASVTGTLAVSNRLSLTGVGTSELFTNDASGMYLTANTGGGLYLATEGAFFFRKSTAPFTEYARITSAGNVGIGTSAPNAKLQVNVSNATATLRIKGGLNEVTNNGQINSQLDFAGNDASVFEDDNLCGRIAAVNESSNGANVGLAFSTYTQPTFSEKMRITSTGVLDLALGQIKFPATQVASADANTLDDYEEGTWTIGLAFGGASVGVTTTSNTGTYTKIGRQVTVNGYLALSNKGSSTGDAQLTGLPFTIPNVNQSFATASLWFASVTFANQFQGYGLIGSTTVNLREITILGVDSALTDADFGNNSQIIVSLTYLV